MEPFFEQKDLRASGNRMLIFLTFYVPAFFFGISYFLRYYPVLLPPSLVYLCAVIPMIFAIGFNLLHLRSHHPVRWITTDSRVIYESPLAVLGSTFNIPVSELASVSGIGNTDFANCTTVSGVNHKLYYKCRGGRAFYHHLSQ